MQKSGRVREQARARATRTAEVSEEKVADNGATSKDRRVRTLLTSKHECNDGDGDDDHDEDDDDDEAEEVEEAVVAEEQEVGDEGNVETTNDDSARGGLERCSNSHIPASNPPGRRTGWRGAPKCRKQVA